MKDRESGFIGKVKKIGIVLTIAILFTIFIFAMTNAIYPDPKYEDFCSYPTIITKPVEKDKCGEVMPQVVDCRGPIEYTYDENGCPIEAKCNKCYESYDTARKEHSMVLFLVSSIVGVFAILFGLFYNKDDDFWDLAKAGFLVGGLISLFVGTGVYYQDMARFLKPVVILAELFIVLMVTYKVFKKK
ncbi:MAG: hypothetical protein KJ583_06355 [Nanoarchaeota archaeon]|nr:hypothetical protein [Nanoarchaeota archaeon]MBU1269111.1 hypothetical protein [Nanoarchaeota archaeon]MBU1604908.1 hypothetical protein [Nanoarchaeota archaeon]MBU2443117.1 hypothetical protein [Nanoarchaeota archaeon]